jgi:HSP20 family protein
MSITRRAPRAPLTELSLLQREINMLFERLAEFDRPEREAGEWAPSVDVFECDGTLVLVVEVPGLGPDSLKVVCRDRSLVISGERRERRPPAGSAAYLCMERTQGRFTRKIPLDLAVDLQRAEGHLANGLLTITVPRLKDRRGRETPIPIRRESEE